MNQNQSSFVNAAASDSHHSKTHLEMDLQAECIRCFYGIMNIPVRPLWDVSCRDAFCRKGSDQLYIRKIQ